LEQAKFEISEKMAGDPHKYQTVLNQLIVQCLIKLLESNVELMCREDDVRLVEAAMEEASA
jgi:vacuolar-type H+-ATPase subunit E/Vma4